MEYITRIVDQEITRKAKAFNAINITGPKGCGKTRTAQERCKTVIEFQDEERRDGYAKIDLAKLEDILFTSNADFSKFKEVLVDGKVVDPKFYDAKSGSTDITLKKDYLKTLAVGEHTLTIASTDGSASTRFYIIAGENHSPETGDNTNIAIWGTLTAASFAALIVCIEELKKKKRA